MAEESSDRLVIQERPYMAWIISVVFIGIGSYLGVTQSQWIAGALMGGMGLLVLVIVGGGGTLIADRTARLVTLTTRAFFVPRTQEFTFDEIASVEIDQSRSSKGGVTYCVVLMTTDGQMHRLAPYYSSGYAGYARKADRLRSFLGLQSENANPIERLVGPQKAAMLYQRTNTRAQTGVTDGIPWNIETASSGAGGNTTRWFTSSVKLESGFVMLIQGGSDTPQGGVLGGLAGSLGKLAYGQYLRMYGIHESETPGIQTGQPVQNVDPRIAENFSTLTSDDYQARQLLNPWAVEPLAAWARRHPIKSIQVAASGQFGPLFVLFSPSGLTLGFAVHIETPTMIDEIARLGADLALANGAQRS